MTLYAYISINCNPPIVQLSEVDLSDLQMESKVLLAKFVQRFNFNLDMSQSFDILEATTLRPKEGVLCTLTPRSEE